MVTWSVYNYDFSEIKFISYGIMKYMVVQESWSIIVMQELFCILSLKIYWYLSLYCKL